MIRWEEKEEKMFWKGRDSRRERLDLIKIARKEISKYSVFDHFFSKHNRDDH